MTRRALSARILLPLAAGLAILSTGACTTDESSTVPDVVHEVNGTSSDAQADALWEHKTAFVGDNSKVITLVADAGFGPQGSWTIALQTSKAPYGVTVNLTAPSAGEGLNRGDFTPAATKLLATVGNLGAVTVTQPGQGDFTLTATQASQKLGYDVKSLAKDHDRLTAYVIANQS